LTSAYVGLIRFRTFFDDPISEYDNFSFHQIPFGYLLFNVKKLIFCFDLSQSVLEKRVMMRSMPVKGQTSNVSKLQVIVFYRKQSIQAKNLK